MTVYLWAKLMGFNFSPTPALFQADANGATSVEYRFRLSSDAGANYTTVQDWSATSTYAASGLADNAHYQMLLEARTVGGTVAEASDMYPFIYTAVFPEYLHGSESFVQNPPGPSQPVGTDITFSISIASTPFQADEQAWYLGYASGSLNGWSRCLRTWGSIAPLTWTAVPGNWTVEPISRSTLAPTRTGGATGFTAQITGSLMPYVAPTAQFYPAASLRVTDLAQYNMIKELYGLGLGTSDPAGSNTLIGRSPVALATEFGIPWVNNPTSVDYGNLPGVFTVPAQSVVNGTTITPDATQNGVQTLASAYTDANGQTFASVTWAWQVEVQFYSILAEEVFTQEIVTWTGDGSANRLIPVTADLTVGESAVWILGSIPVLCTSSMIAAGKHATYSIDPASTTLGVMTMENGGFRITGGTNVSVNVNTTHYMAIVWNSTRGVKMKTGTYTGSYDGTVGHNTAQTVTSGLVDPLTFMIQTGGAQAAVPDGHFVTTDFAPVNVCLNLSTATAGALSGVCTPSGANFVVGAGIEANLRSHIYYYVAFAIPLSDPIRDTMFDTWSAVGTGSPLAVSGFSFTPDFATGRSFEFNPFVSYWRGPASLDAGTNSHTWPIGSVNATGGIEAMGSGSLTLGSALSPTGVTIYGFVLKGGATPVASFPVTTWVHTDHIDNGDGTFSDIETAVESETSPGDGYVNVGLNPTFQWWCNATFGWSVYQIDSPGAGWVACVGPTSSNGWYLSTAAFGGPCTIVSAGQPADPRTWANLATWCTTGNLSVYGGSPAAACSINNRFVYPAAGYTVGTHYPPIRIFDGRADRELCRLPPTAAGGIPKAVISMLAANGTVYLSTWASGTTSADWLGRVFQLDPETGVLTVLGSTFAAGELPYALCWHMGRLWCGTNNGIGTVGKVYYFRPGIDTAWTLDYTTSSSTAGGVTSMASYKGLLYVGTDNAAGSRGKVLVRDTAGAYTTSQTGSGGTARINNGYVALTVLGSNLYASYWNQDTTVISKIEKYTGSAWSTAYTGAGSTLCPYILLQLDNSEIYAVGGSLGYDAVLLVTADGTTWTNLTAELPDETATLLPMFGAVAV